VILFLYRQHNELKSHPCRIQQLFSNLPDPMVPVTQLTRQNAPLIQTPVEVMRNLYEYALTLAEFDKNVRGADLLLSETEIFTIPW